MPAGLRRGGRCAIVDAQFSRLILRVPLLGHGVRDALFTSVVCLFGPITVALCTTAAAAQTTQRARLMVQAGASDVGSVAVSPDGRRVFTGSDDYTAQL
jgi:hypothetical protein